MTKSNKRTPPVFYAGLIVLVLVLFSTHMTGGLYARFVSRAEGSDDARVAKFDVASTMDPGVDLAINLDFYDSNKRTDSVQFVVTSSSEVALEYHVILSLPEKVISWVENGLIVIELTSDEQVVPSEVDKKNGSLVFDSAAFGATGEREDAYTLTFTIPVGAKPGEIIKITDPAKLSIHVEQID